MQNGVIDVYISALPLMLKGCLMTVWISLAGILLGFSFGAILGVFDCNKLRSKLLSPLFRSYIIIFRGTPLFVQLLIVYFALPDVLNIQLSPIVAGIITLALNSTAYLAEIIRAGINSVDPGQWDASYILGYSRYKTFKYIIMPQAIKNVLPAITNEFATLIKESSVLMFIGVPELIKVSKDIVAHNLRPMEVYALTALFYLALTMVVAYFAKLIEMRAK